MWHLMYSLFILTVSGDGQVDFNEFMTILGPKLLSSETREGFLGNTIDTIFWQVNHLFAQLISSSLAGGIQAVGTCDRAVKTTQHLFPERSCEWWRCCVTVTDASPYTRKADSGISGVGREWDQTSGPWDGRDWLRDGTMNVPTVVAARMGVMADRADVKEGTGRWALIETVSEPVLFTHHQLDQRLLLGQKHAVYDARRETSFRGTNPWIPYGLCWAYLLERHFWTCFTVPPLNEVSFWSSSLFYLQQEQMSRAAFVRW